MSGFFCHSNFTWNQFFDHEIILSRGHSINFVNHCRRHTFPIILESKYFGTFKFISNQFMIIHVTSCSFMSYNIISIHIISKKCGNHPNNLEFIWNHLKKNWKNSKIFRHQIQKYWKSCNWFEFNSKSFPKYLEIFQNIWKSSSK